MVKRTVLIVDDQEINRKILGQLLASEYDMLYACNGEEALECLKEHSDTISAVLLDIVMPVMDGYQVLEEMKKTPEISKVPVIVASQKDGTEDEIKALALGAQDFIAKPYKVEIIRHRLSNIITFRETAAMVNKSQRDELTGLYNKQFFGQKLQELLQNNPDNKYDLLSFGIERFKLVNDTYGMRCGDEVLAYVGSKIDEFCKETGICARFSADIYFGVVPHRDCYSNQVFQELFDKVNEYPIDMEIKLHCGIYEILDSSVEVSAMCDRAQLAADRSKGKYDEYFYIYDESIRDTLLEEQFITSHMQQAIDNKEFLVYYQPKYDANTELVAGAEALVRWNQPTKGFMSPGSFIPIFEKNGFITQVDEYVWETACSDIHTWIEKGYSPVAVSVNVSRADIYNPKFIDIMLGLIAKYQIPMKYLHLEITESAYTENPKQIISVVGQLRDLGFIVEMDDFGSGYSSLNMLAEMPVDVLKLDMGFIQSETRNSSGKGILSFAISLAKWLDLAVVAEGVETKEQIIALRTMECNYIQGYYYSKPLQKKEFEKLIQFSKTTEMICTSRTAVDYIREKNQGKARKDGRVMLLVDDIEMNRASLAATFASEYIIEEADNGKEAWEYLEKNYDKVDIVMTDLLMPVMDGFQLLAKIRANDNTKDIPVIVTSQGDKGTEQRIFEMKADDFVSKPFNPEIIRHRVNSAIEHYQLKKYRNGEISKEEAFAGADKEEETLNEKIYREMEERKAIFDIVRLVDPRQTIVFRGSEEAKCDVKACFSVWDKTSRCNNCISLKAYEEKTSLCKLEYSPDGLYFVISQYVPYGEDGAIMEMVRKLDDEYVDNLVDKEILYLNMDEINQKVELDELTGVYNRRHIDHYLKKYVLKTKKQNKDIGIAMVDIDYFKNINDTYGHLVGDEVLKAVAQVLENNIALSKGDFVSRFGGDEFIIVCLDIPHDVFVKRMITVAEIISHISIKEGMKVRISSGCVNYSEYPDKSAQELIEIADQRLYAAKRAGRNRIAASEGEPIEQ